MSVLGLGLPGWAPAALAVLGIVVALSCGWAAILGGVAGAMVGIYQGWGTTGAVVCAVVGFVAFYIADCLRNPRKKCWKCNGKSRIFNSEEHFHNCMICGGSGQFRRRGARVLRRHRPE